MLQAVLLVLVPRLQIGEHLLEILKRHDLARVVRLKRRTAQSLSQDLVAGPDSLGIEGRREDVALDLQRRG